MGEIQKFVDEKIAGNKVMVFGKSYCPVCPFFFLSSFCGVRCVLPRRVSVGDMKLSVVRAWCWLLAV
jgi:hypothetical protein